MVIQTVILLTYKDGSQRIRINTLCALKDSKGRYPIAIVAYGVEKYTSDHNRLDNAILKSKQRAILLPLSELPKDLKEEAESELLTQKAILSSVTYH